MTTSGSRKKWAAPLLLLLLLVLCSVNGSHAKKSARDYCAATVDFATSETSCDDCHRLHTTELFIYDPTTDACKRVDTCYRNVPKESVLEAIRIAAAANYAMVKNASDVLYLQGYAFRTTNRPFSQLPFHAQRAMGVTLLCAQSKWHSTRNAAGLIVLGDQRIAIPQPRYSRFSSAGHACLTENRTVVTLHDLRAVEHLTRAEQQQVCDFVSERHADTTVTIAQKPFTGFAYCNESEMAAWFRKRIDTWVIEPNATDLVFTCPSVFSQRNERLWYDDLRRLLKHRPLFSPVSNEMWSFGSEGVCFSSMYQLEAKIYVDLEGDALLSPEDFTLPLSAHASPAATSETVRWREKLTVSHRLDCGGGDPEWAPYVKCFAKEDGDGSIRIDKSELPAWWREGKVTVQLPAQDPADTYWMAVPSSAAAPSDGTEQQQQNGVVLGHRLAPGSVRCADYGIVYEEDPGTPLAEDDPYMRKCGGGERVQVKARVVLSEDGAVDTTQVLASASFTRPGSHAPQRTIAVRPATATSTPLSHVLRVSPTSSLLAYEVGENGAPRYDVRTSITESRRVVQYEPSDPASTRPDDKCMGTAVDTYHLQITSECGTVLKNVIVADAGSRRVERLPREPPVFVGGPPNFINLGSESGIDAERDVKAALASISARKSEFARTGTFVPGSSNNAVTVMLTPHRTDWVSEVKQLCFAERALASMVTFGFEVVATDECNEQTTMQWDSVISVNGRSNTEEGALVNGAHFVSGVSLCSSSALLSTLEDPGTVEIDMPFVEEYITRTFVGDVGSDTAASGRQKINLVVNNGTSWGVAGADGRLHDVESQRIEFIDACGYDRKIPVVFGLADDAHCIIAYDRASGMITLPLKAVKRENSTMTTVLGFERSALGQLIRANFMGGPSPSAAHTTKMNAFLAEIDPSGSVSSPPPVRPQRHSVTRQSSAGSRLLTPSTWWVMVLVVCAVCVSVSMAQPSVIMAYEMGEAMGKTVGKALCCTDMYLRGKLMTWLSAATELMVAALDLGVDFLVDVNKNDTGLMNVTVTAVKNLRGR